MAAGAAAKSRIVGLTRALALEWAATGIRVNAVAPGVFPDPERRDPLNEGFANRQLAGIALGRFGLPREVGDLVRFLVSEEASYLTGQRIYLDGGMTL